MEAVFVLALLTVGAWLVSIERRLGRMESELRRRPARGPAPLTEATRDEATHVPLPPPPTYETWHPGDNSAGLASGRQLPHPTGGQLLAIAGGLFLLAGAVTFLVIAISNSWIRPGMQVGIGYVFGAALAATGMVTAGRRGDVASLVAVGTGLGIVQLATVAGVQVYDVVHPVPGLVAAVGSGVLAVGWAVRRDSVVLAAFGIVTALAAPLLVDAPVTHLTLALVAVALASSLTAVVARNWGWLAVLALLLTAPQLLSWAQAGAEDSSLTIVVTVAWWATMAAAAVGFDVAHRSAALRASSAGLLFLAAGSASLVLVVALGESHEAAGLLALVAGHLAVVAAMAIDRRRIPVGLTLWVAVVGCAVAALLVGEVVVGSGRVPFWAVEAVALFAVARRLADVRALVGAAAAGALATGAALIEADPTLLARGSPELGADLVAVGAVVAGAGAVLALATSRRWGPPSEPATDPTRRLPAVSASIAGGLLTLSGAYAATLVGTTLAAAPGRAVALAAVTAMALVACHHWPRGPLRAAAGLLLAATTLVVVGELATVDQIWTGSPDLLRSLGGLALVGVLGALAISQVRPAPQAAAEPALRVVGAWTLAAALLAAASVATVTLLTPGAGAVDSPNQGAQLALSLLWGVTGLGGIIVGLRRRQERVRRAGAGLVAVTAAKVLLVDTLSLEAIYRVGTLVGVGLVMLAGGFAYLRAVDAPDDDA